jgi:hypothetical protein
MQWQSQGISGKSEMIILLEHRGLNFKFKGPFESVDHLKASVNMKLKISSPFELAYQDDLFDETVIVQDLEEIEHKRKYRVIVLQESQL